MTDTDYFCSGKNPNKVYYETHGDFVGVQSIRISVLPEAKPEDAAKNAETVAQAVEKIWQKLLEQPVPDDIRQAILKGTTEKTFSQPLNVKVSQSSPKLDVAIEVPDAEKLAALRKMQSKPPQAENTPYVVTTGIKAPEPCAYLEKSISVAPGEYKLLGDYNGKRYGCEQEKKLVNNSTFRYQAYGSETTVNVLTLTVYILPGNTPEQKTEMKKLLVLAAEDVAKAASGQTLSEDTIAASVSGENKNFALAPGNDTTKPQIKNVRISNEPSNGATDAEIKHITFEF